MNKIVPYNTVFGGFTTKPNFSITAVQFKIKSREMESNKENTTSKNIFGLFK